MALPHHSKTFTTLLSLLLLHLFLHFPPATADFLYQLCGTTGSFTANSTYQTNLNHLLSSLSSNSSLSAGFSAGTYGQVPDKVYGLSLCRGDTNSSACLSCLTTASQDILQLCAYKKDATIWYVLCQLRYSNTQFLTSPNIDSNNQYYMWNHNNITNDRSKFDQSVKGLIANISNWAAYNSSKSFATAEMNFTTEHPKIFGLAQCARDLSAGECSRCLKEIADDFATTRFEGRLGGRVLGLWCNMRYEMAQFYDGVSMLQLASLPPASNDSAPAPAPVNALTPPANK